MRDDSNFCDVTLVCDDEKQIEAHRIILASCSPVFSTILKTNSHSHPLLYMRGLKAKDLVAIVDFIYHGETNIYQEDVDGFLTLAEELQLKGLDGGKDVTLYAQKEQIERPLKTYSKLIFNAEQEHNTNNFLKSNLGSNNTIKFVENNYPLSHVKLVVPENIAKGDLNGYLNSMMEKAGDVDNKWICTVCGKTAVGKNIGTARYNMREHIETHIKGLSFPCNLCGNVSRTTNGQRRHAYKYHSKDSKDCASSPLDQIEVSIHQETPGALIKSEAGAGVQDSVFE